MNSVFLKIVQFFRQLGPVKKESFKYSKMAETSFDEISQSSLPDLDIIRINIEIQPIKKDLRQDPVIEIDESTSSSFASLKEKEEFLKHAVNLIPTKSKKNNGLQIGIGNNYHEVDEKARKTYFKLSKTGTVHLLRLRLISLANKALKIKREAGKKIFRGGYRRGNNFIAKDVLRFKLALTAYFGRSKARAKHFSARENAGECFSSELPLGVISPLKARPRLYSHDCYLRKRPKKNLKHRSQHCDDDNSNDADNECSSSEE